MLVYLRFEHQSAPPTDGPLAERLLRYQGRIWDPVRQIWDLSARNLSKRLGNAAIKHRDAKASARLIEVLGEFVQDESWEASVLHEVGHLHERDGRNLDVTLETVRLERASSARSPPA